MSLFSHLIFFLSDLVINPGTFISPCTVPGSLDHSTTYNRQISCFRWPDIHKDLQRSIKVIVFPRRDYRMKCPEYMYNMFFSRKTVSIVSHSSWLRLAFLIKIRWNTIANETTILQCCKVQMKLMNTIIVNRTVFSDNKNSYHIVDYKRPRHEKYE